MINRLSLHKITFILCLIWITVIFIFSKHFVDIAESTETWMAFKGLAYYKDFPVFHFPVGRVSIIPIHTIFDWSFIDSPFIGFFMGVSILTLLYFFGKRFLSDLGGSIALFFFSIFFWFQATQVIYDHEMTIGLFLFCATFIFFQIYYDKYLSVKKLFLLGLFSSLTLMTGQLSALTVTTLIFLTFILIKIKHIKKDSLLRIFFGYTLGLILPIILVLSYVIKFDALSDFYKWNFIYYLTYAKSDKLDVFSLPWRDLSIYYLPMLMLSILLLINYAKNKRLVFLEISTFILILSSLPFNLFSAFHPRHLLFSLPILSIGAGMIISNKPFNPYYKNLLKVWSILTLIFVFFIVIPYQKNYFIFPPSTRIFNDIYPGDDMYETAQWIRENTAYNSKIMVLGSSLFYSRSDRVPASRPNSSMPYSWQPMDEIKKEILANPPDYWIVADSYVDRLRKNYLKFNIMNFIDFEMLDCYTREKSFNTWHIWKRAACSQE